MIRPLAVSLGDPAGVGPELIAEAWARREAERLPPFFVCGGAGTLLEAARTRGLRPWIGCVADPRAALETFQRGDGIPVVGDMTAGYHPGMPKETGGRLALDSLKLATRLTVEGTAGGVVTGPIAKVE